KDMVGINSLKEALKEEYEMKDLGELKYFLGIQVHCNKEQKLIHINQSGYTRTILERYSMQDSKPASPQAFLYHRVLNLQKQRSQTLLQNNQNTKALSAVKSMPCWQQG